MSTRNPIEKGVWSGIGLVVSIGAVAVAALALVVIVSEPVSGGGCSAGAGPAGSIVLGPPGTGQVVGATEYGGPGDPQSGQFGSSGANLLEHPDSYAELGGASFQSATAMGGLPYMTPLRITWGGHSAIAYKRDIGLGGSPISGLPRVVDLWWQLASGLGVPYESGRWSGPVRIGRPPASGAGGLLGQTSGGAAAPGGSSSGAATVGIAGPASAGSVPAGCEPIAQGGVPLTPGPRAQLLSNGLAAAPQDAPPAVKAIIAAGNQIVGKPYVYGAAHGVPLNQVAPAYDCSSSVEHLLYGDRLLPVTDGGDSAALESFGAPLPGRWVTVYANADHVFMYVAGLRWDTHDAAGAGDGSTGIGWHPLVRSAAGFVARHPVGL